MQMFSGNPVIRLVIAFAATLGFCSHGTAQCTNQWLAASELLGTDNPIVTTARWDPDGPGPLSEVLVCGGNFTLAGATFASRIATYDFVTKQWAQLGDGFDDGVVEVIVMPNGDLIAAGRFQNSGTTQTPGLARWNGSSWQPFAGGVLGTVRAMSLTAAGDLIVVGALSQAGGLPVGNIAKWDGASWSTFGLGFGLGFDSYLSSVVEAPNGDIIVAGDFLSAGGQAARDIAVWDGTSWSAFGGGLQSSGISTLHYLSTGELLVGGENMTSLSGGGLSFDGLAMWDGTSWTAPYGWNAGHIISILELANGDVVVGGSVPAAIAGSASTGAARWNGSTWQALGVGGGSDIWEFSFLANGDLLAAGSIDYIGSVPIGNLASWDGNTWQALGEGTKGDIDELLATADDGLVAAGSFTSIAGTAANNIARWDGNTWHALGMGLAMDQGQPVWDMLSMANGDLVVCGQFGMAGGASIAGIARWDGSTWSAFGGGAFGEVTAMALLPGGQLVAAGRILSATTAVVAVWDGSVWTQLGDIAGPFAGVPGRVNSLTVLPTGGLAAAGAFTAIDGTTAANVAEWNGTIWTPMGSGTNSIVFDGQVLANGELVIAGLFTSAGATAANRVARWNGQQWLPLGFGVNGVGWSLTTIPNGDLILGGAFNWADTGPANNLARWDGSQLTAYDNGVDSSVRAVAFHGDRLAVGGGFNSVDGIVSPRLAWLTTSCAATATATGNGCTGSGGANVLTATSRPWIGATFRATATGMPATSLAISVFGLGPAAIPLANLIPQGQPGCSLLATGDLLQLAIATGGETTTALAIPDFLPNAGLSLFHQVLAVELNPSGDILAVTSTNALNLTIGAF